jgi:hypothetical protein
VQRELEAANWSGALGSDPGTPYTGFVMNNAAGGKLDYYLDRSVTYRRASCGAGPATATLTLTNDAPARGLPPYVTIRADDEPAGARPGDNRVLVTYYASVNARIRSITVDGQPVTGAPGVENDHPVVVVDVELPRGQARTIRVTVDEPAADRPVTVLRQPLVRPMQVRLEGDRCGRD